MENHSGLRECENDGHEECESKLDSADHNQEDIECSPDFDFLNELSDASKQAVKAQLAFFSQELQSVRESKQLLEQKLEFAEQQLQSEREEHFNMYNIRASDLVGMPQPFVTYEPKPNGGTIAATARTSKAVEVLAGFNQQMREFAEGRQVYFVSLGFIPKIKKPPSLMYANSCNILFGKKFTKPIRGDTISNTK
jgi:hypothetical protein